MTSANVGWDPELYGRFGDHRLRPALELLARVDHPGPRRVHELGCGTGAMARAMAARWPGARVVASDASPEMLAKARAQPSRVEWELVDATTWRPDEPVDVVFANAVLHWIEDHEALLVRWLGEALAPGGVLAVQMPLSWSEPSHALAREVLASAGPGGAPLGSPALRARMDRRPVAPADVYYERLAPHAEPLDVWETHYLQELEGEDPVLDWVSGTGLRPILEGLEPDELERFLAAYRPALREAYPVRANGKTLYRFPRLFVVARAAGAEGRRP